jgi:ribosomal protein S14
LIPHHIQQRRNTAWEMLKNTPKRERMKELEEISLKGEKFLRKMGGSKLLRQMERQRQPLTEKRQCHQCESYDQQVTWHILECCENCANKIVELDGQFVKISWRPAVKRKKRFGFSQERCPLCSKPANVIYKANIRLCLKCLKKVAK